MNKFKLPIKTIFKIITYLVLLLFVLYIVEFFIGYFPHNKVFSFNILNNMINPNYIFVFGFIILSQNLLKNKSKKLKVLAYITIYIIVLLINVIKVTITNIGFDSILEIPTISYQETLFYIETILNDSVIIQIIKVSIVFIIQIVIFYLSLILFRKFKNIKKLILLKNIHLSKYKNHIPYYIAFGIIIYSLYNLTLFLNKNINFLNIGLKINKKIKNQNKGKNNIDLYLSKKNDIKVIVYAGEATSAMNMSLYNYYRNTTPKLNKLYKKDNKMIVFHNVFSTHTHTYPNLLDILNFRLNPDNMFKPNFLKKNYISLIDFLNQENIKSYYLLNENKGSSSSYVKIMFKNSKELYNRQKAKAKNQNKGYYDHEIFDKIIPILKLKEKRSVFFLFSRAGHGPYLDLIPNNFRKPVDLENSLRLLNNQLYYKIINLFRERKTYTKNLNKIIKNNPTEQYDTAIKYIDFSVAKAINKIKNINQPIILIYFSDHGESPYENKGHDSMRFIHEMARVPFLMYFNTKAKDNFNYLYNKYKKISTKKEIFTLARLPKIISNIFGEIKYKNNFSKDKINSKYIENDINPIVIRKTIDKILFLNINSPWEQKFNKKSNMIEINDYTTKVFRVRHYFNNKNTNICYSNSKSLADLIRASFVTNCIHIDLKTNNNNIEINDNNSAFNIFNFKRETIKIDTILKLSNKNKTSLWMNYKAIHKVKNCNTVYDVLKEKKLRNRKILISFPEETIDLLEDKRLVSCINKLQNINVQVSYTLAKNKLRNCIKNNHNENEKCREIKNDIEKLIKTKVFSRISFDYNLIKKIDILKKISNFKWDLFNVNYNFINQKLKHDFISIK